MSRADLAFVVGGPFGLDAGRAGARRQQAVVRADDASAPARAGGPAGAAVSRAQDPGRRAVPLLMASGPRAPGRGMPATRISERFQTRVGLRPGRAAARLEMMFFLRRIALLVGSVAAARAGRRSRARGVRGRLLLARFHVGARHGRHHRVDPEPADPRRRRHDGHPDDLRRGYDVLRPRHADGAVRRRGPLRTARRAPHAEQDLPAQGPLPDLRVRTRRPAGRQGPARRRRCRSW